MRRLRVAGAVASRAGWTTWAVMTSGTPAAMAARKGGRSVSRRVRSSLVSTAMPKWLSTVVEPWPGKCLAHGATPAASVAFVQAVTWRAAWPGSAPKERVRTMGLAASRCTSATGA